MSEGGEVRRRQRSIASFQASATHELVNRPLDEREELWVDEVLEAAAARLRFGWTQGAFGRTLAGKGQRKPDLDSVAFCLIGALESAARSHGADTYTLRRAERSVCEALDAATAAGLSREAANGRDHPHDMLQVWNDAPGRSEDEVVALVGRALERREARTP
jgi:hypothetical protein